MWNIRSIASKGDYLYARVPEHPRCTSTGYVLHHRIVIENHLGRLLDAGEVVHHRNGDKKDNRIENLEVLQAGAHVSRHGRQQGVAMVDLKCPWCKVIFSLARKNTFLVKGYRYSCCSRSCRGKLSRQIQLYGETAEVEAAISGNLVAEYRCYTSAENPEET